MILTKNILKRGKSINGGWSVEQMNLLFKCKFKGRKFKGWLDRLIGKDIPDDVINKFISLKDEHIPRQEESNRIYAEKQRLRKLQYGDTYIEEPGLIHNSEESIVNTYFLKKYKRGICGIYTITNVVNDYIYIGSSINIHARWAEHRKQLDEKNHHNGFLQKDWNFFGEKNFSFEIVFQADKNIDRNDLYSIEQGYIDQHTPEYNIEKKVRFTDAE
jgi:hypothetical protein